MIIEPYNENESFYTPTEIHPQLPKAPFSMIVNGITNGGKSTFLSRVWESVQPFFNQMIFVWAPKEIDHDRWKALGVPSQQIFRHYDSKDLDWIITETRNQTRERITRGEKPRHILLIFEDFTSNVKSESRSSSFSKIFSLSRGFGFTIWIVSQVFTSVSRVARENTQVIALFKVSERDLTHAAQNFPELHPEFIKECYRYSRSFPFAFLLIRYVDGVAKCFVSLTHVAITSNHLNDWKYENYKTHTSEDLDKLHKF